MSFISRRSHGPVSILDSISRARYATTTDAAPPIATYQRRERRAYTDAPQAHSHAILLTAEGLRSARTAGYPIYESASHSHSHSHLDDYSPISGAGSMVLSPRRTRCAPYTRNQLHVRRHAQHPPHHIYGYRPPPPEPLPLYHRDDSSSLHSSSPYGFHAPGSFRSREATEYQYPFSGRRRSAIGVRGDAELQGELIVRGPSVSFREPDESWDSTVTRLRRPTRSRSLGALAVQRIERGFASRDVVEQSMNDEGGRPSGVGLHPTVLSMLPQEKYTAVTDSRDLPRDATTCMVCHCDFVSGEDLLRLPCLHSFHSNCITKWLDSKNTCPLCRIDVAHELEKCVAATTAALAPA